jgi:hypothetical protein
VAATRLPMDPILAAVIVVTLLTVLVALEEAAPRD